MLLREVKKFFFGKNNSLNKGYLPDICYIQNKKSSSNNIDQFNEVESLPFPEDIIAMIKQEQKYKHYLELEKIIHIKQIIKIGFLSIFLSLLILSIVSIILFFYKSIFASILFFIFNLSFVYVSLHMQKSLINKFFYKYKKLINNFNRRKNF